MDLHSLPFVALESRLKERASFRCDLPNSNERKARQRCNSGCPQLLVQRGFRVFSGVAMHRFRPYRR